MRPIQQSFNLQLVGIVHDGLLKGARLLKTIYCCGVLLTVTEGGNHASIRCKNINQCHKFYKITQFRVYLHMF